jgi:hypothetical protein
MVELKECLALLAPPQTPDSVDEVVGPTIRARSTSTKNKETTRSIVLKVHTRGEQ